MPKILETID